jgi:transcriptional regulator with XRE-family HTH domain
MSIPVGLSHDEYIASRRERDPVFRTAHDEAKATMALALALTDLHDTRNLTQRALAEKSGIKQPMINRIERGSQVQKPYTLLRLLAALDGVLTMRPDGSIHVSPFEHALDATRPCNEPEELDSAAEQLEAFAGVQQRG